MKNIKNIYLFFIIFMSFAQINCSTNAIEDAEFPKHTTENYIYNKTVETKTHNTLYTAIFGKEPNGESITDKTYENLLSNRVTRKRVETKIENGVSFITTETWTSRNPSYLTWINGALIVTTIAGTVLAATTINSPAASELVKNALNEKTISNFTRALEKAFK